MRIQQLEKNCIARIYAFWHGEPLDKWKLEALDLPHDDIEMLSNNSRRQKTWNEPSTSCN
jgi:hypothetical protein